MKELHEPDLDLIKQENQGYLQCGNGWVHVARGSMNAATDTGVFAADLVQEQQRRNRWFNEWLQALTAA